MKTFKEVIKEGSHTTYAPVHVNRTVNHGDGRVTKFKPDEDEKAKALFDTVRADPTYGKNSWMAAQDQRGQSIKMNTLAAMRRNAAKSGMNKNIEHEHVKQLLAQYDIDVNAIDNKNEHTTFNVVHLNNAQEKHQSGQTNFKKAQEILKDAGYKDYTVLGGAGTTSTKGAYSPTSTI